jgi:hypothetical protein
MSALITHWYATVGVPIAIVLVALILIRTLWLPGLGCWLLYFFSLLTSVSIAALGLFMWGAGSVLKHWLGDQKSKDLLAYVSSGVAIVLVFVGLKLLKTWKRQPFPAFMRWFIRRSFLGRLEGGALPKGLPTEHPHWKAHYAAFYEAYTDDRFGSGPVEGWGVRACRRRLLAIKHR